MPLRSLALMAIAAFAANPAPTAPATPVDPYPVTKTFAGMPPPKFHQDTAAILIFTSDVSSYCGKAPKGYVTLACAQGPQIAMPNPCQFPDDPYAALLCHEMAHVNGWPGTHGP